MNSSMSGESAILDPERPWITDIENLPSRMRWLETFLNPLGRSPKLHFTRAWTALFFTQLILWFGVNTLILGIAGLIGADVSDARIVMVYILGATFVATTLMSFNIHARRLSHAGRSPIWAVWVLLPLVLALVQFMGAVQQNTGKYTERYEARAVYLEDPVAWQEAQLDKRRALQAENAAMQSKKATEKDPTQTVEACLASRKAQDDATASGGQDATPGRGSARARGANPGRRGQRRGRGRPQQETDPMALADQALPTQEAFILRPAISGLTRTIMLLSLPVAIWSLLFVARVPTRGPRYPKLGLWAILLRRRGRIGRQQFWAGLLVNLLISGVIFGLFAVLGQHMPALAALGPLLGLTVFIGLQSLISRKRLHDLGVSAWTMVWPWLISLGLIVVAGSIAMLQMQAIQAQMAGCGGPVPMASYIAGGAAGFCVVAMHIGFLLWLGLSGPNCEDETYGPIPAIEAEVC